VLIVDDNEDAANTLAMILQLEGHEIRTAYSAAQALEVLRTYLPDVALLDIGLPELDGYQLAERIRALPGQRTLRLIAITGYGQEADRARTQAAGFLTHLVKPVDFPDLKRVLDDLL
jgi:CheY-like chemotaxis protein